MSGMCCGEDASFNFFFLGRGWMDAITAIGGGMAATAPHHIVTELKSGVLMAFTSLYLFGYRA